MKNILFLSILSLFFLTTACEKEDLQPTLETLSFNFDKGYQGWTVGFSDYSDDHEGLDLKHEIASLPEPLDGGGKKGLLISSHNRPDDIFMFLARKVDGLKPNSTYHLSMDIQFASDAPESAFGIGGAPGLSVHMKAGGSHIEPKVTETNGRHVFNLSKGDQGEGGTELKVIGDVSNGKDEFVYNSIRRTASDLEVKTNAQGECWVVVGTDSGYEGITALYYQQVKLFIAQVD
jgi:hypothetical protein